MVNCIHVVRWALGTSHPHATELQSANTQKKKFKRLIWAHRESKNRNSHTYINMLHSFSGNKLINLLEIPHTLASVKRLKYTNFHIYMRPCARYSHFHCTNIHEGRASLRADIDYNVLLTILSTNRIIYLSIWSVLLKNTRQQEKKENVLTYDDRISRTY